MDPRSHSHRRGSTPSLFQYATINAQIKREQVCPSNLITSVESSRSQPALDILQMTNIRGRVNMLTLPPSKRPAKTRGWKINKSIDMNDDLGSPMKRAFSYGTIPSGNLQIAPNAPSEQKRPPQVRRNSWCK
jgi:hypothetical protein